jgi:hypothetical protein
MGTDNQPSGDRPKYAAYCGAVSAATASGVYHCMKAAGHAGHHSSGIASWAADEPSAPSSSVAVPAETPTCRGCGRTIAPGEDFHRIGTGGRVIGPSAAAVVAREGATACADCYRGSVEPAARPPKAVYLDAARAHFIAHWCGVPIDSLDERDAAELAQQSEFRAAVDAVWAAALSHLQGEAAAKEGQE